jgi:hypothetical protein
VNGRRTWLAVLVLMLLPLSWTSGCHNPRPYAAYKAVAVLENAEWVYHEDTEQWHLVRATWKFKTDLTPEDIQYQYREGYLITPGRFEQILRELDK